MTGATMSSTMALPEVELVVLGDSWANDMGSPASLPFGSSKDDLEGATPQFGDGTPGMTYDDAGLGWVAATLVHHHGVNLQAVHKFAVGQVTARAWASGGPCQAQDLRSIRFWNVPAPCRSLGQNSVKRTTLDDVVDVVAGIAARGRVALVYLALGEGDVALLRAVGGLNRKLRLSDPQDRSSRLDRLKTDMQTIIDTLSEGIDEIEFILPGHTTLSISEGNFFAFGLLNNLFDFSACGAPLDRVLSKNFLTTGGPSTGVCDEAHGIAGVFAALAEDNPGVVFFTPNAWLFAELYNPASPESSLTPSCLLDGASAHLKQQANCGEGVLYPRADFAVAVIAGWAENTNLL